MRFAKIPEEPPAPMEKESSVKTDSDDSGTEGSDETSSDEDSDSEAKRAVQLSYLQKQVHQVDGQYIHVDLLIY